MQAFINSHQLNQIIKHIARDYKTYIAHKSDGIFVLAEYYGQSLNIPSGKSNPSFKTYLWPNGHDASEKLPSKVAFIGLPLCDSSALSLFIEQFIHTNLLPDRENVFILANECQPDETCFCSAIQNKSMKSYDLFVQKEKTGFRVFSGTQAGERVLKQTGVRRSLLKQRPKKIILENRNQIDSQRLFQAISDFKTYEDFWQKTANNCFGCGSCSAVCPLCFCVKQEEVNNADGSAKTCLSWDSCFAKSFSEIQNNFDLRPERADRLYSWYHHKFVRSFTNKNNFLCTGCGRCIKACPAGLDQYKIISALEKREEKLNDNQ